MKKLLIIEDDRDTLDVIGVILEYNEYDVIQSRKQLSVQEIVQINPSIIIVDYMLSDGLGSDLCLQIKTDPTTRNIPVILCSASYKIEQIALDSRADAFIAKPFDLDQFVHMVNKLAR